MIRLTTCQWIFVTRSLHEECLPLGCNLQNFFFTYNIWAKLKCKIHDLTYGLIRDLTRDLTYDLTCDLTYDRTCGLSSDP